jgi:hypothetical protein
VAARLTVAGAVNEAPLAGLVMSTVGAWFTTPVQATPLMANDAGLVFVPEYEPLKPRLVEPLVGMLPFHATFVAVTWLLFAGWLQFADQPCDTRWLPGKAKVRAHPSIGSPRFRMVRLAVNPVDQSFVV